MNSIRQLTDWSCTASLDIDQLMPFDFIQKSEILQNDFYVQTFINYGTKNFARKLNAPLRNAYPRADTV